MNREESVPPLAPDQGSASAFPTPAPTEPAVAMGEPRPEPHGLSNPLELLNSQLVLYARDFRKMVQAEQQRSRELVHLRQELAEATRKLKHFGNGTTSGRASAAQDGAADDDECLVPIIGKSRSIQRVLELCRRVATSETTVLLTGETGTGKELTARRIHVLSPRRDQPFVAINCGALPEALLESELFGHEKGAFTGAASSKAGLFELANGGSILLDEVGEMPVALQVKLLRVLEERQFRRVGGTRSVSVDVRVIAATNRDLKAEVQKNRFRADLYYRLNVFPIELPPLRQRVEDIVPLAEHFLTQYARAGGDPLTLGEDTLSAMLAYEWPGNIRELRNTVERAVLLTTDQIIGVACLPVELRQSMALDDDGDAGATQQTHAPSGPGAESRSRLANHERALVLQALTEARWNKAAAARRLGISWDNLRYRIKKYGLKPALDR